MGVQDHKDQAKKIDAISAAVVTVSDTRTAVTDKAGPIIANLLREAGHEVICEELIPDEPAQIEALLFRLVGGPAKCIVFTGGTGLSPRDHTVDTISPFFDKRLDGFGELFRYLSFEEIGSAAMLSRATAGVVRGHFVVCLPGSPKAVELAMQRLLIPELNHIVWQIG